MLLYTRNSLYTRDKNGIQTFELVDLIEERAFVGGPVGRSLTPYEPIAGWMTSVGGGSDVTMDSRNLNVENFG